MRRKLFAGAVAGGLALGAGFFFTKSETEAQTANNQAANIPVAAATQLPIQQVVLFSSGVGYFQREGEVQGNSRIDLSFPVQDINDLIKSMVLQDLGGGHVSAVSYDSQAPIEKTLRSFAINLTNNPSFGQILNQARGEKVEATLQQGTTTQPGTMTGVVMGVEKKREAVNKEAVENEFINLWCAEGMRSVKLSDVQRVRFLNPVMDSEVKKALETLSLSHDTQKKAVSLAFAGEGKRAVKVGYVVENPIWKTSYRLVMDKKGKPFLQGWAVVENTQDEDWNNVRMALVSGRPISFQMDLYQPLFVSRPVVEPELFASLRPPTYQGNLGEQRVPAVAGMGGQFGGNAFGFASSIKQKKLLHEAERLARKADETTARRLEHLALLELAPFKQREAALYQLLEAKQPRALQLAALKQLLLGGDHRVHRAHAVRHLAQRLPAIIELLREPSWVPPRRAEARPNPGRAQNVRDGSLTTRWTTERPQKAGDWLELLPEPGTVVRGVAVFFAPEFGEGPATLRVTGRSPAGDERELVVLEEILAARKGWVVVRFSPRELAAVTLSLLDDLGFGAVDDLVRRHAVVDVAQNLHLVERRGRARGRRASGRCLRARAPRWACPPWPPCSPAATGWC